uniref:Cerebellin 20 n=1 Tax=Seriola dumerili TaxID=41447 RepID=A0A3B4UEP9_SERDU
MYLRVFAFSVQHGPGLLWLLSDPAKGEHDQDILLNVCFSNLSSLLPSASPASRTAFSVALFNDVTFQCYGPFTLNTNIIYKHVFLNLGDSYSVDTGIFTVPHSGVYTIAITIYSDAGSSGRLLAACACLQVNGQVVSQSREQNRDDQEDSATVVLVLQLMAGDKVAVNLPEGCFLCEYNSFFNTFSAFLLYATE